MKKKHLAAVAPFLLLATMLLLSAESADAAGTVYITNCAYGAGELKFFSFNGKDSDCSKSYDKDKMDERETISLKCKGQGKGRCKITMLDALLQDCSDLGRVNVDHDDTLLVFETNNKQDEIRTYATVSAESANCCGDDVSDTACDERYSNCTAWDFSTSQCASYLECMVNGGEDDSCKAAAE